MMSKTKEPIFVHIPKTGGTSINCVMKGTEWQTPLNYHYRHLDPQTKQSTAGDIFQPESRSQFESEYIFMMLREPLDRLVSEYFYIRKNHAFFSSLSPQPEDFEQYATHPQTANTMLKFLLGKTMYENYQVNQQDLDNVIAAIELLDINVGIFEEYSRSLSYFNQSEWFSCPSELEIKRATLNRPNVKQIDKSLKQKILEHNALDIELYQYCVNRLAIKTKGLSVEKIKHKGGKYDFVIPYTMYNCILDVELNNRRFILENERFFVTLNMYLHKTADSGKVYVKQWIKMFKAAVAIYFAGSDFGKEIKKVKRADPLDEIIAIARIIDTASSTPSKGLELGSPKIKLQLNQQMASVLQTQQDKFERGTMHW